MEVAGWIVRNMKCGNKKKTDAANQSLIDMYKGSLPNAYRRFGHRFVYDILINNILFQMLTCLS